MRVFAIVLGVILVLLVAGYWFATGGAPSREPAEWLTAQPIAHRGQWTASPERPENSLAAFAEAAGNGLAVELDVQLSADNRVVVFHDEDLKRMTGAPGAVSEKSLVQLQDLRLLGGDQTIPTLAEVFSLIDGRVPVFVEIKNPGAVGALEEETARVIAGYEGEAAVMAFNPFALAHVAATAPEIPRGQLSSAFEGEDLAFYEVFLLRNLLMNWKSKPDFIAYDLKELPSTGTKIQQWRGRPLLGWTAESEQQRLAAEEICDGVICNPAALPSGG